MKLFTVGPVQMYENTLKTASRQLPYFRTSEFSQIMFNIENKLKNIVYTDNSSKVAVLTASGTGAMESVIASSFNENDNVLIVNGGSFGHRFCKLCEIHNINYETIDLEFGEQLKKSHFDNIDGNKFTGLLVNIHETSTGQLYDINIIKEFTKKYNIYLIVDAISSFLADEYKMDDNGIDCTIISSQKALALSPGISIVILNNKFYQNKIKNLPARTLYLDLNESIENMKRGQTPFTPAVGTILELNERLNLLTEYGVENIVRETKEKALYFRNLISKFDNIEIPNFNLSNTLTPIYFKEGNAKEIFNLLKDKFDIFVTPSGGALENKLLRVGHIGNLKKEDFKDLVDKMEGVINK